MTTPVLPVPELEPTVQRLLSALRPLQDDAEAERSRETARQWLAGDAPVLQQRLLDFARREDAAGRSWLSREWLRGYLRTRESLPLSTSVGFQLADEPGTPGLDRAARFTHRAAAVHLQHLRGETPVEVSPRGAHMCMQQWEALGGGLRHPQAGMDEIRRPRVEAADAEIGILHRGRLRVLPIADADGQPRSAAWIAQALRTIVAAPGGARDELPFGAVSWLPADAAAQILEELLQDSANARTYDRLSRLVFTVDLQEQQLTDEQHLQHLAFGFHDAWVRKPMSYEIALHDSFTGVHVEHSTIDGAAVLAAVGRMQQVEIHDAPAADPDLVIEAPELAWSMTAEQAQRVRTGLEGVAQAAEPLSVRLVTVPRAAAEDRPFRMSDDAVQQLIFTIAQQLAFGRVRSVYESVDVREFQAGRTECLRPVTAQAVELAAAVVEGAATQEQLRAAIEAHKDWIKACKAGHGPQRHVTGLRLMADEDQVRKGLLGDPSLEALSEDFLSTTSVGGAQSIVRYAFAPTSAAGFGIAYTKGEHEFEFCLSFRADTAEDPDGFAEALVEAAQLLWSVVGTPAR